MSNLKILMNGNHHREPDIRIAVRYVSDIGNDLFSDEWYEYGTCNHVRVDLFQHGHISIEKCNPGYGPYSRVHCRNLPPFVTVVQMCMEAFIPALYASLGLFIPLIVVNCIVLGRAEAFAAKNGVVASAFDGIGIGLGFTIALTLLGAIRELLGTGKLFNLTIMPEQFGSLIFVLAPGAFIALGFLIAIVNKLRKA